MLSAQRGRLALLAQLVLSVPQGQRGLLAQRGRLALLAQLALWVLLVLRVLPAQQEPPLP